MAILPAQTIRSLDLIEPFHERTVFNGMTYGLSGAGYDVRIAQDVIVPTERGILASTIEYFNIPSDVLARVCDKSSWARKFMMVQNTVIEPGWYGYLTLELTNNSGQPITISKGMPIAQVIFERLEQATEQPYQGRYQNQGHGPQPAIEAAQGDL
jgi:dCTP deaminase